MILLFIIIAFIALIVLFKALSAKPKTEFSEWQWHRDTTPKITHVEGQSMFQNQSHWNRYNHITKKWESKLVTDPVARPFSEATSLSDKLILALR
jgi:hypothetical protein